MKKDYRIMEVNAIQITVTLNNGEQLTGYVNIVGYKRFSDFIEKNEAQHIKLFKTITSQSISSSNARFLLIPKTSISYYEPFDK
jgi:sRNA-binding regulator protein Hfq